MSSKAKGTIDHWLIVPALHVIFLGALAIRCIGLERDPLWADEIYTYNFALMPFGDLWFNLQDVHPPTYYSLVKLVTLVCDADWAIRLPTVLFSSLTVYPLFGVSKRLIGPLGALVAVALFAFSNISLEFAQEARSYSVSLFVIVSFGYALFRLGDFLIDRGTSANTIGSLLQDRRVAALFVSLAGLASLGLGLHYQNIFPIGFAFLIFAGFVVLRARRGEISVSLAGKLLTLAVVCGVLAAMPWVPGFLSRLADAPRHSVVPDIGYAIAVLASIHGIRDVLGGNPIAQIAVQIVPAVAIGAGFVVLVIERPWRAVVLSVPLVSVPVLMFAISPLIVVFLQKTLVWTAPAGYVCAAYLLVTDKWRSLGRGLFAAYAAGMLASTIGFFTTPAYQDWRAANQWFVDRTGDVGSDAITNTHTKLQADKTAIVFCNDVTAAAMDKYGSHEFEHLFVLKDPGAGRAWSMENWRQRLWYTAWWRDENSFGTHNTALTALVPDHVTALIYHHAHCPYDAELDLRSADGVAVFEPDQTLADPGIENMQMVLYRRVAHPSGTGGL